MMIKLFLLAALFSVAYPSSLKNPQSFGLQTIKGEPLDLLKLETKATAEAHYVEIQYTFLYKNPFNDTIKTKFVFPPAPAHNSYFNKFEAILQNQIITAKVVENSDYELNSDSNNFLNIPSQETVQITFSMIQDLKVIFSKFYELIIPPFLNHALAFDSIQLKWNLQIELKSNYPFAILHSSTHKSSAPELSEKLTSHSLSNKTYQAFWNLTINPDEGFQVHFGYEDQQKPQVILATHPQNPNDHILMLSSILNMRYVTAEVVQNILQNTTDGLLRLREHVIKQGRSWIKGHCLFIIDRSDSMKGSKIQSLKEKFKMFLHDFSADCGDFNIISFGSTFQLYEPDHEFPPSGWEEVQKAIAWVDTIEADMGGSNLLEVLKYISKDYDGWWDYDYGGRKIIFTDGDFSYPEKVRGHLGIAYIVGIGDDAAEDMIKRVARGGAFVLEKENFREKVLEWIEMDHYEPEFMYKTILKCYDDQNQLVHDTERHIDCSYGPTFTERIHLSNVTNLKFCHALVERHEEDEDQDHLFEEKIEISGFKDADTTDIWHKLDNYINMLPLGASLVPQTTSEAHPLSSAFFDLSYFNQIVAQEDFVMPENYIPLDSMKKQLNIDL